MESNTEELTKLLDRVEKKKQYNRNYYLEKTKPKKENKNLEDEFIKLRQDFNLFVAITNEKIKILEEDNVKEYEKKSKTNELERLRIENIELRRSLDEYIKKCYELTLDKIIKISP